ncbi:MAG: thiol peroxidase [Crocinitomicaceae bacterium]|nr:thiol peroxidase [Crocinitomicaceae bacterium]MBK8927955.1 thiol peroxidase [Crocinitomicaceae bacterium]
MATISLKGEPVTTSGNIPATGSKAKNFSLVKTDLSKATLDEFTGNKLVLNIFPSIDTGTCAMSVRQFNKIASELPNTKVLCISRDLPFAMKRFCGAEGLENVINLSDFATGQFGIDYGLRITSGKLCDLNSRVVIVVDANGTIQYAEQVQDIANEPDYDKCIAAVKAC